MSYYNLEQTLEVFRKDLPETLLPFGLPQLADLCRRGGVTPVFSYAKYVSNGFIDENEQLVSFNRNKKYFNGYLTLPSLTDLLFQLKETVVTRDACVFEEIGTENKGAWVTLENDMYSKHDYYNEHDYHDCISIGEVHYIGINNLLFSIEQVQAYISSKRSNEQNKPLPSETIGDFGNPTIARGKPKTDKERIIELEKELAALKVQLEQQTYMPADESALQTVLNENHKCHAPDLKHAIQLWIHLYIDGAVGDDSHSNKANLWIKNNTPYGDINTNSSVKRLREVTTPLKDFGGQRKKEIEK